MPLLGEPQPRRAHLLVKEAREHLALLQLASDLIALRGPRRSTGWRPSGDRLRLAAGSLVPLIEELLALCHFGNRVRRSLADRRAR